MPATNTEFWRKKFEANRARDRRAKRDLKKLGWRVIVVWECQTSSNRIEQLAHRLTRLLAM